MCIQAKKLYGPSVTKFCFLQCILPLVSKFQSKNSSSNPNSVPFTYRGLPISKFLFEKGQLILAIISLSNCKNRISAMTTFPNLRRSVPIRSCTTQSTTMTVLNQRFFPPAQYSHNRYSELNTEVINVFKRLRF